ncbi:23S rRNA (pseudouridine(1915)-N(3))-methyltransferase RlmH [Clostridium polynesiense]|uniref:23S rRNA (pseudouridine(1915)-N(3))-methyltransferase RlmH n=1 Tax=Clostridium polynesiense TaxID=1325933 RepID=UPI00058B9F43|nr:23S rRNA (pseudouridine(1915)-N(3))-methyltransferase RlmH [Clostridium polynesiense]
MNITVISVGKLKEKYLKQAIEEYSKRLQRYCKLEVIELNDEKTPDNASEKEEEQIKIKEGRAILKHIKDNSYVIALDLKGKMISSEELASFIQGSNTKGISSFTFIIGGSLGLSQEIIQRADYKLCFSKMTFPHQLFRVMLLEQIYRGFRIIGGEPYHK